MMRGVLASHGYHVSEVRVGHSLRHIYPRFHHQRQNETYRQINPPLYRADYFGEKMHIDQIDMFGVTHIGAIDGYSGKIVAFSTMPIKNNITIYETIYSQQKLYLLVVSLGFQ